MPNKGTNREITQRVNAVYKLILAGSDRATILQYAAKQEWNVCDRTVDEAIARATDRLKEVAAYDQVNQLGAAIARLELLFGSCLKVQDYKGALSVQREINALLGLAAPIRIAGADGGAIRHRIEVVYASDTPNDTALPAEPTRGPTEDYR